MDVSLMISSPNSSSERRITPSWSVAQLKGKLEPVTGIPTSSQRLLLRTPGGDSAGEPIEAQKEEQVTLQQWGLRKGCEIVVEDLRPAAQRPNFTDASGVEKYVLPEDKYEELSDSVLAWKRQQKLGRFDPDAPARQAAAVAAHEEEAHKRGIEVGKRARIGGEDTRRGTVRYVGLIPELPGPGGWWAGVELDEPVGKNDGSVGGTTYFQSTPTSSGLRGVFVRPERVDIGNWPILNELEDLEEI